MTAKADRAKELLEDPILQEAFENLRESYRKAVFSDDIRITDETKLELIRLEVLSHRLEKHLQQIVADGQLEDFRAVEESKSILGDLWNKRTVQ